jgi:hypothetical protein
MSKRTIKEKGDRPQMVEKLRSRVWGEPRMGLVLDSSRGRVAIAQAGIWVLGLRRPFSVGLLVAACIVLAGCKTVTSQTGNAKIEVTKYRGQGYVVRYPAYWSREESGKAIALKVPTEAGKIFFSIGEAASSRDEAFNYVRANFPSIVFDSPEPTVYGAWRGDTITGHFTANGQSGVVSATAIEANNTFYELIMIAPTQVQWDAYKLREALANTLTFDRLPSQSRGTGAACSDCGGMLSATMSKLTSQTSSMMR